MDFNIQTPDTAFNFLLDFLNLSDIEIANSYYLHNLTFEDFWRENAAITKTKKISGIRVWAFHITSSLDSCKEIKQSGLKNLQHVLSEKSSLNKLLLENNVEFDIYNKKLLINNQVIDIDYDNYSDYSKLNLTEEKIRPIAHRLFYDYCITSFLCNDNILSYGTNIHLRPEILYRLCEFRPDLKHIEDYWIKNSKCYKVNFFIYLDQINRITFGLDETRDPEFKEWNLLTEEQKLIKWMIGYAYNRTFSKNRCEEYIYCNNEVTIPPEQIDSIEEIKY